MSEKAKGKGNPFAGHLRPTEEVLWMSTEGRDLGMIWQLARSSQGLAVISMIVFSIGIMMMIVLSTMPPIVLAAVALVILILSSFPVLVIWGVHRTFNMPRRAKVSYAVTNERLLHRSEDTIFDLPLERIGFIGLKQGQGNRGTLNFGQPYGEWLDIADAARVKHIIEEAREKRLKESQS